MKRNIIHEWSLMHGNQEWPKHFFKSMNLLDSQSLKVRFHATFTFFTYDNLHWRMVSPSSSFFSIHENASWKMYPTHQVKMFKIFNKIFEVSFTKGGLRTSSCPCVVSFEWSHSNVTFACAWAIAFYSFHCKIVRHHSKCGHLLPIDFDVKAPLANWKVPKISLFNNELMHPL